MVPQRSNSGTHSKKQQFPPFLKKIKFFINPKITMYTKTITILLISFLLPLVISQSLPMLNVTFTGPETNPNLTQSMILNNVVNSSFLLEESFFDCSLPSLYTYNQSDDALDNDTATNIVITTTQTATLSISTKYNILKPTISSYTCSAPSCTIQIQNNCLLPIHYTNYFDLFELTVSSGSYIATMTYYVYCKFGYSPNTLEWGLILEIFMVTILIAIVAMYSKPWSLGGRGIEINVWLVLLFIVILIIGAVIAIISDPAIHVCLTVLSFILGIFGIGICTNELLFLFRIKFLNRQIFNISTFEFRILETISLSVGVGFTVGWYFSGNNIFLNDIVSLCICIGLIKILKFTNLKIAGLAFMVTIILQLVIVIVIYIKQHVSYNTLFLNKYNFPFELQFPTLNPAYNQKCAWLPITSVAFPGILLSYLRRFDSSRNTTVYLVTSTVLFLFGGIAWVFVNIPSDVDFPFGLISEPCMFGLVCIFAYQRREIRVIWSGEFYDEEFANQKELRIIMELIDRTENISDRERESTIDKNLIEELKANSDQQSRASDENVVRSKFLRQ